MSERDNALTVGEVLTGALKMAHWVMNGTADGIDDELVNRPVPGKANPIGSCYLHVALSDDSFVNGTIRGGQPLFAGEFAGRYGGDKMEPHHGEGDAGEWFRTVKVDMAEAREYMAAVMASTEEFVAGCTDADFARVIDNAPVPGMTLAQCLEVFIIGHCNSTAREISALKGTFGLTGYPV